MLPVLHALPAIQLVSVLVAFVVAVSMLRKALGNAALILLLALPFQGVITEHAFPILTEAMFMAGFILFTAGLAAAARAPSTGILFLTGIGLLIATAAKSIGFVLFAPAILLIRFLPSKDWRRSLLILLLPGLAYTRVCRFTPTCVTVRFWRSSLRVTRSFPTLDRCLISTRFGVRSCARSCGARSRLPISAGRLGCGRSFEGRFG